VRCSYPDPNHLPPAVQVAANGLVDFSANRGEPLGELWGDNAIAREPLMIEPLQLLDLARL
jgi:hypothetical protein